MLVRSLLAGIILLGGALGCGPGRGGGRRRSPRKLTPLVFKQHIPNLPEFTMAASGSPEGPLSRTDPKFKQLVPNYNADIIFRDEEGSGSDRLMTKRCLEKLNMLSISVMNQWPGLRLRVTESYDEEFHHSATSLHYEGRAVDITTSDRDRSKYGLLARLAIEAGFDYVSYASRSHIHASVKSESAYASRSGGCFSADSVVQTPQGSRNMSELSIGDEILVVNGDIVQFSPIIMFLDRDPSEIRLYVKIKTQSSEITMTPSHLLFIANDSRGDTPAASKFQQGFHHVIFAEEVQPGDFVYVSLNSSKELVLEQVLQVTKTIEQGVYAPLTHAGNLLVNNVVASCYAILKQQSLAHLGFVPYRVMHNFFHATTHFLQKIDVVPLRASKSSYRTRQQSVGIHWYADLLYKMFSSLLPEELLYPIAFD